MITGLSPQALTIALVHQTLLKYEINAVELKLFSVALSQSSSTPANRP